MNALVEARGRELVMLTEDNVGNYLYSGSTSVHRRGIWG